jgi:predicted hydrocarbon binding protein
MRELEEIEKLIKKKIPAEERVKVVAHTAGRIICSLAKHLIKDSGYGVVSTIMSREMRNLGKNDARNYMKIFGIREGDPKNASKLLRIAAFLLGLKLKIGDGESLVVECPYGASVKEFQEPFICNVCLEYCRGIVEEVLGPAFIFERTKWLVNGDECCAFKIRKSR